MSTFMGLNIGASALRTYQTAVNTTANNISNVETTGYTRQTTEINATSALRHNSRYGSLGSGVEASKITQTRNEYYDVKYRNNAGSLGLYEQKLYYLNQVEDVMADNAATTGFSTIFSNMFNALDSVISDGPGNMSTRNQFINKAQQLCTYFNSLYNSLQDIQKDCNEEIKSSVDSINSMSEKIMLLNKEIYGIEVRGGSAANLRDQRNNLIDELSSVVGVEVEEVDVVNTYGENTGATTYRVYINGQTLVDGFENRTLDCVSDGYSKSQCDIEGLYHITWSDTGMNFAATSGTASGSLKALFMMRDGNNADVMKGTVEEVKGTTQGTDYVPQSIKVSGLSITDVESLAIPEKGRLTVGSYTFKYDSFEMEMDADGTITSITYKLSEEGNAGLCNQQNFESLGGSLATTGEAVDAMGVPYYMTQINNFIRTFANLFNEMERGGQTLDGKQMGSFFTAKDSTGNTFDFDDQYAITDTAGMTASSNTYYKLTAGSFEVNSTSLKDASYFATTKDVTNGTDAYDIITDLKTLQSDVTVFRGNDAESFLEVLLSDISVDTNKADTFYNNFNNLSTTLSRQRTSVSGVDEDEEAVDLIRFQNAYNMASKIISVMSEMYDRLITETGVT